MVDVHSDPDGASGGDCDFPVTVMDKTSNQPVIEHHGNKGGAGATLSRSKSSPESSGHDDTLTTVRLPTTRKKGVDSGFSVEASIKDGSAECARNQRSCGKRYRGLEGATAMAKAQRSYGNGGGGENRGGEKNDDDSVTAFKGRPGSQKKPRQSLFPCQRDTTDGRDALGTPKKVAGHVA